MDLRLPPDNRFYLSCETLLTTVNQHDASEGYALVTKRSKKTNDGELRKVWLRCDKGAKYVSRGYGN